MLQFTTHAIKRCQQRGINRESVKLIAKFGTRRKRGNACVVLIPKGKLAKVARNNAIPPARLEQLSGVAVVMDRNKVLTVYHISKNTHLH